MILAGPTLPLRFYHYDKTELCNLAEDISESNDLSEKYPEKTAELEALLKKMQDDAGALFPVKNPDFIIASE